MWFGVHLLQFPGVTSKPPLPFHCRRPSPRPSFSAPVLLSATARPASLFMLFPPAVSPFLAASILVRVWLLAAGSLVLRLRLLVLSVVFSSASAWLLSGLSSPGPRTSPPPPPALGRSRLRSSLPPLPPSPCALSSPRLCCFALSFSLFFPPVHSPRRPPFAPPLGCRPGACRLPFPSSLPPSPLSPAGPSARRPPCPCLPSFSCLAYLVACPRPRTNQSSSSQKQLKQNSEDNLRIIKQELQMLVLSSFDVDRQWPFFTIFASYVLCVWGIFGGVLKNFFNFFFLLGVRNFAMSVVVYD